MDVARPRALQEGDLVGIAASSSPLRPDLLEAGVRELESLGFRVRTADDILARHLYMAGDDERRAREVNELLRDPQVRAVFCARGGYGWPRILDRIEWPALVADPRPLVGFSDATAALGACLLHGVAAFHGPMVAWDLRKGSDGYDRDVFLGALTRTEPLGRLPAADLQCLRPGRGEGPLVGGCLSLLASMVGTPYMAPLEGSVLFLEDWKSKPYQIDRCLQQLRHAGLLQGLQGVVFGRMLECRQQEEDAYTLQEVVLEILEPVLPAQAPIAYGLASGHVDVPNLTLPLGIPARLTASPEGSRVEILEAAVR